MKSEITMMESRLKSGQFLYQNRTVLKNRIYINRWPLFDCLKGIRFEAELAF
jgi:hypothetical protein